MGNLLQKWKEIVEIAACKQDRETYDDICLSFRGEPGDIGYITEDFIGCEGFLKKLETVFPGIRTNWFLDVAFPAFAANRTAIWGEPARK
jgi:hypothetical protein